MARPADPADPSDPADQASRPLGGLGAFIHEQRTKARLSLRQLAELANVSNPYLSQIERGLHEPSVRVLKAIAAGLDLSADVLLAEAGLLERVAGGRSAEPARPSGQDPATAPAAAPLAGDVPTVEAAIQADPQLQAEQKAALIGVYRSYVASASASVSRPA